MFVIMQWNLKAGRENKDRHGACGGFSDRYVRDDIWSVDEMLQMNVKIVRRNRVDEGN